MVRALEIRKTDPRIVELAKQFTCAICQEQQRHVPRPRVHLEPLPPKWQSLQADAAHWRHPVSGKQYQFLMVVDEGSRFRLGKVVCEGSNSVKGLDLIDFFRQHWKPVFGNPDKIRVDPAGALRSEEVTNYFNGLGIEVDLIPAEAHWQNSLAERSIQSTKHVMSRLVAADPTLDVHEALSESIRVENEREIVRGYSPAQHALGKTPDHSGRLHVSNIKDLPRVLCENSDGEVPRNLERMKTAEMAFQEWVFNARIRRAKNTRSYRQEVFTPGDLVFVWRVQSKGPANSAKSGGFTGPARVLATETRVDDQGNYRPGSIIWVIRGNRLLKTAPQQLRRASVREQCFEELQNPPDLPWTMTKLMDDLGPRQFDDVSREIPDDMEWERAVDEEQVPMRPVPPKPPLRVWGKRHVPESPGPSQPARPPPPTVERDNPMGVEADGDLVGEPPSQEGDLTGISRDPQSTEISRDPQQDSFHCFWNQSDAAVEIAIDVPESKRGKQFMVEKFSSFLVSNLKRKTIEVNEKHLNEQEYQEMQDAKQCEVKKFLAAEPPKHMAMRMRWVLTWKRDDQNNKTAKARCVILGFLDPMYEYRQTHAPTMSRTTRQIFLAIAAALGWSVSKGDVSGAFLQGREYPGEAFVIPTPEICAGMKIPESSVTRLRKACYGLVDAPLEWFLTVSDYLTSIGFTRCVTDPCCFKYVHQDRLIGLISGHVDDFLFSGSQDCASESLAAIDCEDVLYAVIRPEGLDKLYADETILGEIRGAGGGHAVVVFAQAGLRPVQEKVDAMSAEALGVVQRLHPNLLLSARRFSVALNAMAIPVDEVCARVLQFAETFLAPKNPEEMVSAVPLLLAPLMSLLESLDLERPRPPSTEAEVLGLMGCAPSLQSTYARRFLQLFLPPLRRMVYQHKQYLSRPPTTGLPELQRSLLAHLHLLQNTCGKFSHSSVPLADLSPELLEMFKGDQEIILPIEVQLLSTKTKPKKLDFEAQDGSWHSFLLKGRDDLRLDGRIMQLLRMANAVVETSACKALEVLGPKGSAQFRCRGYDVVPIAPRAGLIRWVSAVPLFVIHKQRRQASQKHGDDGSEKPKALASADLWHRKIQIHLRAMDSDVNNPRKHWPLEALRRTFEEMQADSPVDLISRELLLSSLHPGEHFLRQRSYTLSTAFSSILGYLIGLGDRHLDNLLLDLTTGEVVHVDYSICFDRGQRLRVPERVPFRLTRCMVHALGPLGLGGQFAHTMELGLALMAEWRELIVSLTEPCLLLAPVNDWVAPVMTPFVGGAREVPQMPPAVAMARASTGEAQLPSRLDESEWSASSARAPPPQPPPPEPSDGSESEESHGTQARDEDDEEEDAARSEASGGRGEEECLLAQDREDVDDPLPSVFHNDLRERGPRLMRTGSGPIADPDHREGEDGEADEEDDDDYEADDSNLEQGASGAEAVPSKRPRLAAPPKCALAAYALGSIHRKIPRQARGADGNTAGARLDLEAESLIATATNPELLAQMYEGWTSWI
eukprot:s102_g13.t1